MAHLGFAIDHQDVAIKHDGSEYSTDLQKCIEEVEAAEQQAGVTASTSSSNAMGNS